MKIALVRQRYTAFGGAERFVARAMQTLRNEGTQLTIITRKWKANDDTPTLTCNPFHLGSLWRDWGFARCVCNTLKHHSFDLVQSHERIPCCDIYRAGDGVHREWLKQRRRILSVMGKIGLALNPYHHYVLAAEQKLFSSPQLKAVICNSRMVKNEIQHYFGLPEEKLHVIYSGVDTEAFHPRLKALHRENVRMQHAIPLDAPLFLFVGSGFERKGLALLLQALALVPQQAHLLVVGKDKNQAKFLALANTLGLSSRVHFIGGKQDVKPFYGAADAFVLPTLYDPFPNVALEAMACALPLITSLKSGAAEFIRNGENGFVCDAFDQNGLASYLTQLTAPQACEVMGQKARATVEPLTLESMGERLIALYHSLIERK